MSLREYLVANLFDGDDAGTLTAPVDSLVDDICENVALWMVEQSGAAKQIEEYYGYAVDSTG